MPTSPPPTATTASGLHRAWDPRVWGTFVGAAGGTVFVWANAPDLPLPVALVARVLWAVAFLAYVWFVLVRPRPFEPFADVSRRAGAVYLLSVVGMLVLIRVGTAILVHLDRGELRPPLIVAAVGAHFLPFAPAFATPFFRSLGWTVLGIGLAGLVVGWVWGPAAAAGAAVGAGIVMIVAIARDAASPRAVAAA